MSSRAERWYRVLASGRGAMVAAVVVVAASAVAIVLSIVPSRPASDAVARLARIFEAGDPFRSWWFVLVLIFAALTALAWLLEGVASLRGGDASFPVRLRATSSTPVSSAVVRGLLAGLGGRVREGDGGLLVVERGRRRLAAPVVASGGCLLAALGALLSVGLSTTGTAFVPEGGAVYSYLRRSGAGPVRADLGAELQVQRHRANDGQAPRWRVELARGAEVLARADLGIGDSLRAGGRRYRLRSARPGDAASRFLLAVGKEAPRPVAAGEPVRAGTDSVAVVGFEPNLLGRYGPAARVTWVRPGSRPETGWVLGNYPDFDRRVRRSRPAVRLAGFVRSFELLVEVERSFGGWIVFLGVAVLLLGLLFLTSPPYARLQARPIEGGWRVEAVARRDAGRLADEVDEILARLRAAGRPSGSGGAR